jgi:hypothetical protein
MRCRSAIRSHKFGEASPVSDSFTPEETLSVVIISETMRLTKFDVDTILDLSYIRLYSLKPSSIRPLSLYYGMTYELLQMPDMQLTYVLRIWISLSSRAAPRLRVNSNEILTRLTDNPLVLLVKNLLVN